MTNDRIYCPDCGLGKNRRGDVIGTDLELIEHNYSGCAVDMMHCPECGHAFAVTYKVDKITREQSWEDKEEVARLLKEKEERTARALLRRIVNGTQEEREAAQKKAVEIFEKEKENAK